MVKSILIALVLTLAAPAAGQSPDQRVSKALHADGHEQLVDGITTALVGYALLNGLYQQEKRNPAAACGNWLLNGSCDKGSKFKRLVIKDAIAIGVTVGIAETVKHVVHRTRPDGSDDRSFFSEHTALATLPVGWLPGLKTPVFLSFSVGVGRVAAQKHFPSDVVAGAAVGYAIGRLTR